ncbi:MAG: Wzz/FepE/Etk N-terminal domain-containing protein [Solibacillus sp.]
MEKTMTARQLLVILKKRFWLLFGILVLFVGVAVALSYFVLTPKYEAQTQILVNQKDGYSWDQTQTDLRLINTYNVIIASPVILTEVINRLDLAVTPAQLAEQMTVSNENDSKVVNIVVLNESAQQAVAISNMIAEVFQQEVPNIMAVDNIKILSYAKQSESSQPVSPNLLLNILLAFLIGSLVGIGFVLLLEALDTTISNEFQVEEIFELPVVGMVGTMKKGR